eukprot:3825545-Prymnesium_polylepis.1
MQTRSRLFVWEWARVCGSVWGEHVLHVLHVWAVTVTIVVRECGRRASCTRARGGAPGPRTWRAAAPRRSRGVRPPPPGCCHRRDGSLSRAPAPHRRGTGGNVEAMGRRGGGGGGVRWCGGGVRCGGGGSVRAGARRCGGAV